MTDPSAFDTPIRRAESRANRVELLARLRQHGVTELREDEPDGDLADLLSAIEGFEAAVRRVGGDLFVDSPDSSEPEDPDLVLPHPHADEHVRTYMRRIRDATARLERRARGERGRIRGE